MASAGAVAVESPVRRELGAMTGSECPAEALRKADSLQARSSISLHAASSGDGGRPRHKRARRDAVRRVWDWLDVSMNREASMGLGASTGEAVQFGQMHLSEGSPATTVITATLDVSPGDAVEPCVSSLPDIQAQAGDTVCVSSRPRGSTSQAPQDSAQLDALPSPLPQHESCSSPREMGHEADSKQRDPADNGAEPWQCQLASHSAAEGSAQREGSAADRSLLGDAYQRQGSSRKRKHGSPDLEPAHAAGGLPQIVSKTSAHSQHESFS